MYYLGAESETPSKRRRLSASMTTPALRSSPRKEFGATRLLSRDTKVKIFQAVLKWKAEGSKPEESPVGRLVNEFSVGRFTPKRIIDKVILKGSVDNTWFVNGRPAEYSGGVWDGMTKIIRDYRKNKQERAPPE